MTPLHDACCNGHLDVIELLLDSNASVLAQNDSGETPLDILKNYREQQRFEPTDQIHYESIIARMASVLEKTGKATHDNKKYKHTSPTQNLYQKPTHSRSKQTESLPKKSKFSPISNKMSPGCNKTKSPRHRTSLDNCSSDDSIASSKKNRRSPRGQPIGTLRNMIDNGSSDDESSTYSARERLKNRTAEVSSSLNLLENDNTNSGSDNSDYCTSAKDEYKRVMQNLRSRLPENIHKSPPAVLAQPKRSAYLTREEVGDDWLDDDLNINRPTKKRKFGTVIKQNYIETSGTRKSNSPAKSSRLSNKSNSFNESRLSIDNENDCQIISNEFDDVLDISDKSNDSFSSNSFKKRKSQLSLLDSGFSRKCSSPETVFSRTLSSSSINKTRKQQKISSFTVPSDVLEPDSTTSCVDLNVTVSPPVATIGRTMYAINVRIESKLWRVPVPANEVSELTIGWLANEAAKRYYRYDHKKYIFIVGSINRK